MSVNLEHFDPRKFARDGGRVARGRPARLTRDEVEQALFLERIVRTAQRDLSEYLAERGFASKQAQCDIVLRMRRGWRPR